ncbi:MAG: hypothetical protein HKL87_06220 [Acidimicrobiaceae bacterium]|nr:hypothetical protein [Acidimicrobiaceae bacterium]
MSVVSLPRRSGAPAPAPRARPRIVSVPSRPRPERVVARRRRVGSPLVRGAIVVGLAGLIAVGGTLVATARAVQLHQLDSQVLDAQASYAAQVGSASNVSTPSVVASAASTLHLVNPTSVTQVPSVSLGVTLGLPQFSGWAPVTPRTSR